MANRNNRAIGAPVFESYGKAVAVTPSDTTDLGVTRALYVGTITGVAGTIAVQMADGENVTFTGEQAGIILPLAVQKVLATGTDASNIVALY